MAEQDTKHEPRAEETTRPEPVVDGPEPEAAKAAAVPAASKKSFKDFLKSKKGKVTLAIIAGVILIAGVLLAVPGTRYALLGTFIRKDVSLQVFDNKTGKPVSDADVSLVGRSARTDHEGKATISQVPVGQYQLSVKKKYYKDAAADITVPILTPAALGEVKLEATGRQVQVMVGDKISGAPLEKVAIQAGDATAITNKDGQAVLVLPAGDATVKASLKADGYNAQDVTITVIEQKDDKNIFTITPAGKLYFLSKRTGKISVMKANLDGSDAQVVVAGTGKEDEGGTVLLASRDWKYLLLQAKRDSDKAKLYLINTSTDQMTVVDEGDADFSLVGWNNHTFVYRVERTTVKNWQPKKYALKSFDADANKLLTLDESAGEGTGASDYRFEHLTQIYIIDSGNKLVYTKNWNGYTDASGKQSTVTSIQTNGSGKKVLKTFDAGAYLADAVLYEPDEIYYRTFQNNGTKFYEYEDGAVKESGTIKNSDFGQFYPTYLLSPSGEKTFWYEPRDGKNTLLLGDKKGQDGKEIITLSEFTPYGWFSDKYLLVSKAGSELYLLPSSNPNPDPKRAIKVTDYHKPNIIFNGYGGGYGGL